MRLLRPESLDLQIPSNPSLTRTKLRQFNRNSCVSIALDRGTLPETASQNWDAESAKNGMTLCYTIVRLK